MRKVLVAALLVLISPQVAAASDPVFVADWSLPVAGRIHNAPAGQQFGSQGECWTEDGVAYLQRFRPGEHVRIGGDYPIPGNDAVVRITMRLGELPALETGQMQLFQGTPSDGVHPSKVIELRIDPSRRMTVGVFKDRATVLQDLGVAPVDAWFTVTFAMPHIPSGRLRNPRQTIGGTDGTLAPFVQEVSFWSIVPRGREPAGQGSRRLDPGRLRG